MKYILLEKWKGEIQSKRVHKANLSENLEGSSLQFLQNRESILWNNGVCIVRQTIGKTLYHCRYVSKQTVGVHNKAIISSNYETFFCSLNHINEERWLQMKLDHVWHQRRHIITRFIGNVFHSWFIVTYPRCFNIVLKDCWLWL